MDEILDLKRFYNEYSSKLNAKKVKLALAKENNNKIKAIESDFEKIKEVEKTLEEYVQLLNIYVTVCSREDNSYRERRINYITSYIDNNLETIFPNEGFKSKIYFDYKHKVQRVKLTLIDKLGVERNPRITEGMMLQQLISFSASIGLCECMMQRKIYMDEAFSASSPENLTKVSKLLKSLIEKDFQVILIEQKDDIYKDLPRREINLVKSEVQDNVVISSIVDY